MSRHTWDRDNPVVPFDKHGNMYRTDYYDAEWRRVVPFDGVLTLRNSYSTGYSNYWVWEDSAGYAYPMFISDVEDLVRKSVVAHGRTQLLTWTYVKRGVNYGIKPVFIEEIK